MLKLILEIGAIFLALPFVGWAIGKWMVFVFEWLDDLSHDWKNRSRS